MGASSGFYQLAGAWYERCRIKAGEKVVLVADSGTNEDAAHPYFHVALAMGAEATLFTFERPALPFSDVPPAVEGALIEADFIHQLTSFAWSYSDSRARVIRRIQSTGRGRMTWGGGHPMFLEVPPDERVIERTKLAAALIDGATELRITSALGTDLRWKRGDPRRLPMLRHGGDCDQPGRIGSLNGGIAYSAEPGSARGVFVLNGGVEPVDPMGTRPWMVREPVRIEVEGGRITRIDTSSPSGRTLAEWFAGFNDPAMYEFVHTNLGLDHRARLRPFSDRLSHSHSAWGGVLVAFGRNYNPLFGMEHLAPGHVDLFLQDHDYYVDGRQIMRAGQYTEASGLA